MIERFDSSLRHVLGCLIGVGLVASPLFASDDAPVLKKLKKISTLSSTVPSNGDVNPYGLVRVPNTIGNLREGHFLVSNFNASSNLQGTGATIVDISLYLTKWSAHALRPNRSKQVTWPMPGRSWLNDSSRSAAFRLGYCRQLADF